MGDWGGWGGEVVVWCRGSWCVVGVWRWVVWLGVGSSEDVWGGGGGRVGAWEVVGWGGACLGWWRWGGGVVGE